MRPLKKTLVCLHNKTIKLWTFLLNYSTCFPLMCRKGSKLDFPEQSTIESFTWRGGGCSPILNSFKYTFVKNWTRVWSKVKYFTHWKAQITLLFYSALCFVYPSSITLMANMIVYLCKIKSTDENCLWDYCHESTRHYQTSESYSLYVCVPLPLLVCVHCPPGQKRCQENRGSHFDADMGFTLSCHAVIKWPLPVYIPRCQSLRGYCTKMPQI